MTGAGELRNRIVLQKQSATSDGAGGTTTAWADQFERSAKYTHLRNGETVMAGRLQGRHTLVARIRASAQTRVISTDWRFRDERTSQVFNIREVTPTEDRAFLDLLCESGVAT